jgi:hypothetical protein
MSADRREGEAMPPPTTPPWSGHALQAGAGGVVLGLPALSAVKPGEWWAGRRFRRRRDLQVRLIVAGFGITSTGPEMRQDLNFGLGDAQSTSGTLAPMAYLFTPKNIDPTTCFKTVRSSSHQANSAAVANDVLNVATNNTVGLLFAKRETPKIGDALEVIWTSPPLPESSIIVRKDLDPAVKEKMRQFFLTYGAGTGPDADRQREVLKKLAYGGFRAADDSYLDPVREMQAAVALSAARKTGDKAKAQAEFDKVKTAAEAKGGTVNDRRRRRSAAPTGAWSSARPTSRSGRRHPALLISFHPVEMGNATKLFTNSENMRQFGAEFLKPDWTDWKTYVAKMWLTVQIAMWGTFLAVFETNLGFDMRTSSNLLAWSSATRLLMNLLRSGRPGGGDPVPGAVGLGPFAGVMALAINTGAVWPSCSPRPRPPTVARRGGARHRRPTGCRRSSGGSRRRSPRCGPPMLLPVRVELALGHGAGLIGRRHRPALFDALNAFAYHQLSAIIIVIIVAVSLIDLLAGHAEPPALAFEFGEQCLQFRSSTRWRRRRGGPLWSRVHLRPASPLAHLQRNSITHVAGGRTQALVVVVDAEVLRLGARDARLLEGLRRRRGRALSRIGQPLGITQRRLSREVISRTWTRRRPSAREAAYRSAPGPVQDAGGRTSAPTNRSSPSSAISWLRRRDLRGSRATTALSQNVTDRPQAASPVPAHPGWLPQPPPETGLLRFRIGLQVLHEVLSAGRQEKVSAKARTRARSRSRHCRQASRGPGGGTHRPEPGSGRWARGRIGGHRRPRRHGFQDHQAEGVGERGRRRSAQA